MTNYEKITQTPETLAEFLIEYELEPTIVCPENAWDSGMDMPKCPKHGACALCALRYLNEEIEE